MSSHTPLPELLESLISARANVQVGSIYYHYRSPDQHYKIIDHAIDEATDNVVVIYKPLYLGDTGLLWTRSLKVWSETVDGVPRFTKVE